MSNTTIAALIAAVLASLVLAYSYWPSDEASDSVVATASGVEAATEVPDATPVRRPSFDVVRISREGTGVIAGRAEQDAFVEIHAGDEIIGRVRANEAGEWVFLLESPLAEGAQELTLVSHLAGADPVESDDIVVLAIPEREEELTAENGVIAVLSPRYGGGVSRILQRPGSYMADYALQVAALDYDERGRATFSGTAEAGADIRVYLDNEYVGDVTADPSGRWSFSPDNHLFAGAHVLRLDQMLEGDGVEIRVEQPFDTGTALDIAMAESHVVVRPGNNLWHIARRVYGSGVLFTQIFRANNDSIKDPDLIYPGQKFLLPKAQAYDTTGT